MGDLETPRAGAAPDPHRAATPGDHQGEPSRRGGARLDSYAVAACLIFAAAAVCTWESFVGLHEELYFLGSRRIADPAFLVNDFTWSKLSPTTALYDHLLAPLWSVCDAMTIANLGRALFWGLLAVSGRRCAPGSGCAAATRSSSSIST